jgi:cell division septum initiation protein DivIVA
MTLYSITPDEKIRELRQEIDALKAELATARAQLAEIARRDAAAKLAKEEAQPCLSR